MGGDEFIILLRNINDKKAAENVVKKIHRVLQEVIYIGDNEFSISSSIGVSIYPDHGKDSKILLRNADLSMYKVKRNGKDNFQFFDSSS